MKYLDQFNSKIISAELKLRYIIKNLPFFLKVVFLILLVTFIISSLFLLYQLDKKISVDAPTEGGALTEGIIGTPRFVNPVLTISDADRDLSMLIYSGLLRAEGNELIPDLAEDYEISADGLCYTFTLRQNILWSDNTPITSDDIIFTIDRVSNPSTKSPKRASWEGVETEKIDDQTVKFCLQKPYSPFLENTTIGIIPKHIWNDVLPEQMPLSDFNIKAIGSGPYKIKKISRNSSGIITSYILEQNKNFALQKTYIKKLVLKFYPSEQKLIEAYKRGDIDSLSAISPKNILEIQKKESVLKTYLLPRIFAVFFNQDNAALFAEQEVREALNLSVNKKLIVNEILQNFGTDINGPIPPGILDSINTSFIENFEEQLEQARELLKKNGWSPSENDSEEEGVLEKTKSKNEIIRLEFSLSTSNVPDLVQTAQLLQKMWKEIGAKVNIKIFEIGDLEQSVIRPRKYDSLLFGEIMGRDPDAFAFWHSSQRNDPGLNIALYANITVDKILEEVRTIFDPKEREKKYEEFQNEIIKDTPAVFLYSPQFIHLLPKSVLGLDVTYITTSSERFSQVYQWHLKTRKVWKIFLED